MTKKKNKIKLRLRKNSTFLGLMKKYRSHSFGSKKTERLNTKNSSSLSFFKNNYSNIINIFFIFELTRAWKTFDPLQLLLTYNLVKYYAITNSFTSTIAFKQHSKILNNNNNNMVVLSRPHKQLFLMIFKSKPVFIFTGGLMRIIMNEKRKSSRKLYKVAISLIKLLVILLSKRNFFVRGHIKLINVGTLRSKILINLLKIKHFFKINYVIIKFSIDFSAQKFETRRSIKKYIKKRFKIR